MPDKWDQYAVADQPAAQDKWDQYAAAPQSSGPAPDLTSNPKGEGLYRMGSYDFQQGNVSKPEIKVPFSKVQDAQNAGYNLHPDESSRYQKDFTHQGQGPTFSERARNLFNRATAPMPDQPLEFNQNPSVGSAFRSAPAALANIGRLPFNVVNRAVRDVAGIPAAAVQTLSDVAQGKPEGIESVNPVAMGENAAQNLRTDTSTVGPVAALGNLGGDVTATIATGKAAAPLSRFAARTVGAVPEAAGALRDAAMEDPDAAALRAQNIGPKSSDADSTLRATAGARPYLQGATDLEDLKSKIKPAKDEIWGPYQETIDAIGDKQVPGPDGPTTIRELEKERKELSAINRGLKTGKPQALQLAEQKGLTQAQSLERETAFQNALDPHLEQAGINPKLIRQTFGQVSEVGDNVLGRSTLIEPTSRFGVGRIANFSTKNPFAAPGEVVQGGRDIVAGRPTFGGKATDVAVREAFRHGGPKPDFGRFNPESQLPQVAPESRQLPAPSPIIDAEFTPGTVEGRTLPPEPQATPSVITPAPDQQLQLPAQASPESTGALQPAQPTAQPLNAERAVERTRPPAPPNPQPMPPGRTTVTPEGTAIPERKLLTAPKSGKTVNVGDSVTVKGVKGTVTGMNPQTGKIEIQWEKK